MSDPNIALHIRFNGNCVNNYTGDKEKEIYWFHPDHLGSSSYITGADGEVTQNIEYFPSGETFVENHRNSNYSPYKFNGKELDAETGYYYYGARYYNPRVSLWLNVDPLAEKYPDWSPYVYTLNNPIIYTDPDGRDPKPGMLILSYRGYIGGWNMSSRSSGSTSFNLAYGLSKYTTMNYPVSGVQVNIGFDSFYFKDRTTAWAYIKAINNLDAINNNEAHHATFNSSVKMGSKTYDTSQRPQNYDDGAAAGQAISELGCNCGAVMMGAMGASTSRYSSVNEVLENPNLLKNQSAENFTTNVELPNNWKAETLKRGSNKGGGYKATEYDPKGNPTGKYIRYNPGSKYGRKGGGAYWRVSNGHIKSEPIKGK